MAFVDTMKLTVKYIIPVGDRFNFFNPLFYENGTASEQSTFSTDG